VIPRIPPQSEVCCAETCLHPSRAISRRVEQLQQKPDRQICGGCREAADQPRCLKIFSCKNTVLAE